MLNVQLPESEKSIDFSGWSVLRLESLTAHQIGEDERETRVVYANWGEMPTPLTAVLRAMYGSQQIAREAASEQARVPEPFPVAIPTRFVWLPIDQLREWLGGFEHLLVPVGDPVSNDAEGPIRTLRIDLGEITKVFEKRWQSRDATHEYLNRRWRETWNNMTQALLSEPPIEEPVRLSEHSGWLQETNLYPFRYDSELYDPERHEG